MKTILENTRHLLLVRLNCFIFSTFEFLMMLNSGNGVILSVVSVAGPAVCTHIRLGRRRVCRLFTGNTGALPSLDMKEPADSECRVPPHAASVNFYPNTEVVYEHQS